MDNKTNKIKFIQKLAYCLHTFGAPCYRIEAACYEVSKRLGFKATSFFSTPTSLMSTYQDEDDSEETRMIRVEPANVNLHKLAEVNDIGDRVASFQLDPLLASGQLDQILDRFDDNRKQKILSYAILAANFALILNGHWVDILLSFFIGWIVGIITSRKKNNNLEYLSDGLAGFFATILSYSLVQIYPNINPPLITLAALIVLLPGLNLTISISELTTNNLTSGTSRLMGALMVLFKLAFGVYVGREIIAHMQLQDYNELTIVHPFWLKMLIFPLAALGFTFSFKASLKDYSWIFNIGVISMVSSHLATTYFGQIFGIFTASLIVTACSNYFAKKFSKPVLLMQLPGIISLVPGSLGYRSVDLFFHADPLKGMELAFSVTKIAMALVAGLFFGNVIVNPKKNI